MAGAAAVAGAVYALAKRKEKVNVTAVMPLCENRISSGSFLPGDVITSYSGKTIEIGNTDAEGRLILADAVTYAIHHEHATRILDIATLTGAVVNMLGFSIAGVLCDDHGLWQEFEAASEKSGEKYWLLPFGREHEKMIESDVADIKNIGGSVCGTIAAGLFIRAFAEGLPWIHLDIAGTAWTETPLYEFQIQICHRNCGRNYLLLAEAIERMSERSERKERRGIVIKMPRQSVKLSGADILYIIRS